MKTRRRLARLAVAAALVLGSTATLTATAGPAFAQSTQLCLGSGGYDDQCLNAWFGGPQVANWHGGVANDAFIFELIDRCDSSGTSTTNCPIPGNPAGKWVAQIRDTRTQKCVGDENNSPTETFAGEVTCNGSNGYGGGWGTVFELIGSSIGCYGGSLGYISAHFTPDFTDLAWLAFTGPDGSPVALNAPAASCLYQDDNL